MSRPVTLFTGQWADLPFETAHEMINIPEAAKRFGVAIVNGFTGSPIWHLKLLISACYTGND